MKLKEPTKTLFIDFKFKKTLLVSTVVVNHCFTSLFGKKLF